MADAREAGSMHTGHNLALYYFGGEAFTITKKRDGFLVRRMTDGRIEFLSFFEGLLWRALKGIPKRFLSTASNQEPDNG